MGYAVGTLAVLERQAQGVEGDASVGTPLIRSIRMSSTTGVNPHFSTAIHVKIL